MAYQKQTWRCGEVVTADKLNHMEDGIANCGGGSTLRVNIANIDPTEGKITYDKTWQEVHDALESGMDVTYQHPHSYPSGIYLRIFDTLSIPVGSKYFVLSEMFESEGSDTPMLVVNGTFFTVLSSPDDYLILQGGSGGGSAVNPPITPTT